MIAIEPGTARASDLNRRAVLGVAATVGSIAAVPFIAAAVTAHGPRREAMFDADWAFHLGDVAGAERPAFDDRGWRRLDLPHDWSIEDIAGHPRDANWSAPAATWSATARGELKPQEYMIMPRVPTDDGNLPLQVGPFDPAASAGGAMVGWVVGGTGWYRKRFIADPAPERHTEIRFDGAFQVTDVWCNGAALGRNVNGFTGFAFDLTPHLIDGDNLVAVRVRNEGFTSRWYSGSGLYRHVWLTTTNAVRLPMSGVSVTTPSVDADRAHVAISADIENRTTTAITARVEVTLVGPDGHRVARRGIDVALSPNATGTAVLPFDLANPALWSPDGSSLYTARIAMFSAGQLIDETTTRFGIRAITIDTGGLTVNGRLHKLKGACVHHDNGLLGARAFDRAEYRKVERLKANGFNAIRCAHNPPSPAFLDACDDLGMLVIDEAFDVWEDHKVPADYATFFNDHWRADLAATIRRDRNHPSVILWSLGNEIRDKPGSRKSEIGRLLRDEARRLDPTRGVITALNEVFGPIDATAMRDVDVVGVNYRARHYADDHAAAPMKALIGTESYAKDMFDGWRQVEAHSWLLGEFAWTGIDYLGETGLGSSQLRARGDPRPAQKLPFTTFYWDYPAFMTGCGDLDVTGNKKAKSYYRDVLWGRSPVEIQVQRPLPAAMVEEVDDWGWPDELSSWTWDVAPGTLLTVRVYTGGDEVRLLLDDRLVGHRSLSAADKLTATFDVSYHWGHLEAVAFARGRVIGRQTLATVGPPAGLRIVLERSRIERGPHDLAYAAVEVIDAHGSVVPDAIVPLRFTVAGAAALVTIGSANPRGVESLTDATCRTFHGRALAIIRPLGRTGIATLCAASPDLASDRALITII